MIPQPVTSETDYCVLADRWQVSQILAWNLVRMTRRLEFGFSIISGYRTVGEQEALRAAGRPTAPAGTSTHTVCPAQGVDVWPSIAVTDVVKARLGEAAVSVGLRWGGGSPIDPETGIPSDWNHLDLGPRVDRAVGIPGSGGHLPLIPGSGADPTIA